MLTFLVSIVPSAGALLLFWLALRAVLQADRRERTALARIEAAQDAEARRHRVGQGGQPQDEALRSGGAQEATTPGGAGSAVADGDRATGDPQTAEEAGVRPGTGAAGEPR